MDTSSLKKIIEAEKAVFGFKETARIAGKNQIEEILIASNCPEHLKANLNKMNLKFQDSGISGTELAAICKKSFNISVIGIRK
jgi:ribosomal protein L30E